MWTLSDYLATLPQAWESYYAARDARTLRESIRYIEWLYKKIDQICGGMTNE